MWRRPGMRDLGLAAAMLAAASLLLNLSRRRWQRQGGASRVEAHGGTAHSSSSSRRGSLMSKHLLPRIALISLLVPDYDEAIAFFVDVLKFELVEDRPEPSSSDGTRRWVIVRPPGAETGIVLARPNTPAQRVALGNQLGGRVGFFLHTDDFAREHARMAAAGIRFREQPRCEPYGIVAVWEDPWGNPWDLLQPSAASHLPGPSIALATCATLSDNEVDDKPLHELLQKLGAEVSTPRWDDASHDWTQHALVVPRTTWDYQERPAEFAAWLDTLQRQTRLCNPQATLVWSAHKRYLRDLEAAHIPVLPTLWLRPGEAARVSEAASFGCKRALVKPAVGATSSGCLPFVVGKEDEIARAHAAEQLCEQDEILLQPFCASVMDEGEYSVMLWDGELSHGVRKVPLPGDFRTQDDFGATDEPWTPPAEVVEIAHRAANLAPAGWAYARVDFLRDASLGWCVLELKLLEPSLFLRHAPMEQIERLARLFLRLATAGME